MSLSLPVSLLLLSLVPCLMLHLLPEEHRQQCCRPPWSPGGYPSHSDSGSGSDSDNHCHDSSGCGRGCWEQLGERNGVTGMVLLRCHDCGSFWDGVQTMRKEG